MAVDERWVERGEDWPSADELVERAAHADLLILPDRIDVQSDGATIASFREEAQAFRVDAVQQGLTVDMVRPEGSTPAAYREHTAQWVLPVILAVPVPIIVTLISNRIQRWIDQRGKGDSMPSLRYREAHVAAGIVRVRELEGPADEVLNALQAQPTALEEADDPSEPNTPTS